MVYWNQQVSRFRLSRLLSRYVNFAVSLFAEHLLMYKSATLLLRVDDIVSARRPEEGGASGGGVQTMGEPGEDGPEQ